MNFNDYRSARAAANSIRKQLDNISRMITTSPGLVRIAADGSGDNIAFWNNGSPMEYNVTQAHRRLTLIELQYPDALKTRSGFRTELPLG